MKTANQLLILLAVPCLVSAPANGDPPASAEGIVQVTSLDDYSPGEQPIEGTLRSAIEKCKPPCVIRFSVSGSIPLRNKLEVTRPFITIDGSTAPGDGITIQRHQVEISNTHDVILQYLRLRCGDGFETEAEREKVHGRYKKLSTEGGSGGWRSLLIFGEPKKPSWNIRVEHCSIQNSTDDNAAVWNDCHDITFRCCIFSGGYDTNSKAFLAAAEPGHSAIDHERWLTIDHCLFARTQGRAPDIGGGVCHLINNVISGPVQGARFTNAKANVMGNYFLTMPNHPWPRPDRLLTALPGRYVRGGLYIADNFVDGHPREDSRLFGITNAGEADLSRDAYRANPWPGFTQHAPPSRIIREVLEEAGCTKPRRDPHDRFLIEEVARRAGVSLRR